ncbi:DUF2963 domain-containing protein, partial [Italian clover phyllody phytoplasma]|uniref:DUF2963 domain-containing protein n=1 Tax=Italian clover phyllody phytoplasma TaxID=1196420 RepID=UPI0012671410
MIKETNYNPDGITIDFIIESDHQTGTIIKKTYYNNLNSKKIDFIIEYDPQTGNQIKKTGYTTPTELLKILLTFKNPIKINKKLKKQIKQKESNHYDKKRI